MKVVALALCALLLQSLGAAFVHVVLVEHTYCEDHQALEHAGDEDADERSEHGGHAVVDSHGHVPDGEGDGPTDETCDWLSWLQGPTVPVPQAHASLLDLPPPAEDGSVQPLSTRAPIPSPIDLLRLSPGHSPPA